MRPRDVADDVAGELRRRPDRMRQNGGPLRVDEPKNSASYDDYGPAGDFGVASGFAVDGVVVAVAAVGDVVVVAAVDDDRPPPGQPGWATTWKHSWHSTGPKRSIVRRTVILRRTCCFV